MDLKFDSHINSDNKVQVKAETPYKDDSELWRSFKDGDEGAFIVIYKNYVNILFNVGLQYTLDEDLIKDCLQDFFIYTREKRSNLADVRNIKFYLIKSFSRRIITYLKKSKKNKILNAEEYFKLELAADNKFLDSNYDEEQIRKLNNAIKKLSKKEKEAIYYFYYQNLSYTQIAEIYNYDHISSARRLIYKCLKKLKKNFLTVLFLLHFLLLF